MQEFPFHLFLYAVSDLYFVIMTGFLLWTRLLLGEANIVLDHLIDLHAHLLIDLLLDQSGVDEKRHQESKNHEQNYEKDSQP